MDVIINTTNTNYDKYLYIEEPDHSLTYQNLLLFECLTF